MSPGAVWWCGPLRRGPAAHRALLPHEGGAEACRGTRRRPCASERRRGAGTRRIMSEALNSDSTNRASFLLLTFVAASGRPNQSQVAGLRHPDQFAHGGDGAVAFFAADEPCGARSPTFSREVGWPGDRGPRAPTEPYVTVSRHTALVVLASPHGTGFGDPGPVHEVARRLLDARVPLPHGSGPAGPQSAVLPPEPPDHVGVDSSQQGVER